MKKVSVQFNLTVEDNLTHKTLAAIIKRQMSSVVEVGKITSVEINNVG